MPMLVNVEFDESLKNEKEQLEELLGDLECHLVARRDQGLAAAMRLQNEEAKHALETFVSCKIIASL